MLRGDTAMVGDFGTAVIEDRTNEGSLFYKRANQSTGAFMVAAHHVMVL